MNFKKGNPKMVIGALILGVIVLLLGGYFIFNRQEEEELLWETATETFEESTTETQASENAAQTEIMVDVKGAIKKPGVYTLSTEARLNELILIAGGFTDEAEIRQLNLAEKLSDQQMIYVPNKEELEFKVETTQEVGVADSQTDSSLVNLNTADSMELQQLPGVGPAKAQAILSYREENGAFNSVDDLLQISGFGEKTVDKLREMVSL